MEISKYKNVKVILFEALKEKEFSLRNDLSDCEDDTTKLEITQRLDFLKDAVSFVRDIKLKGVIETETEIKKLYDVFQDYKDMAKKDGIDIEKAIKAFDKIQVEINKYQLEMDVLNKMGLCIGCGAALYIMQKSITPIVDDLKARLQTRDA